MFDKRNDFTFETLNSPFETELFQIVRAASLIHEFKKIDKLLTKITKKHNVKQVKICKTISKTFE